MGHPTTEKTQCSLLISWRNSCCLSCFLHVALIVVFCFRLPVVADCLAQAMLVASQNLSPFWFAILSGLLCYICTPQSMWFCSVGQLGLFFAVYVGIGGCALYVESVQCLVCFQWKNKHVIQGEFYLIHGMRLCSFRYKTMEMCLGNSWLFFSSNEDGILCLGLELLVRPAWLRIQRCLEAWLDCLDILSSYLISPCEQFGFFFK